MYTAMNIALDFTRRTQIEAVIDNQPLAVMPAELAKKLLKMYAKSLVNSSNTAIIDRHINELKQYSELSNLDGAILASMSWLAERELIQNISNDNWDAYTVPITEQTQGELNREYLNSQMH